jgi:hypothetical protein
MGVIIDDFEIVPESKPAPAGETPPPAPQTPAPVAGANPEDIRFIIRTRDERALRLFAH